MAITLESLLSLLASQIWSTIASATQVVKQLYRLAAHLRLQGIYDVLDQTRTVTVLDPTGHAAAVDTVQRVRFRQNHITALTEYAWGEGDLFAEYRCSPGVPVDRYCEGSRQVMLISLREHKNAGGRLCFRSHRRILDGFLEREEYWECDIYHHTKRLTLRIIFPSERPCQRATVTTRSTRKTVALGPEHFQTLADGRQVLRWAKKWPKLNERYLIRWVW